MSWLSNIGNLFTGKTASDAAAQNAALIKQNQQQSLGYLNSALTNSSGALSKIGDLYGGLQSKYGAGTNLYLNALGVNGQPGTQEAQSAFTTTPGYQFQVDQATEAAKRSAASLGLLGSGNTLAAISDRAGNIANTEYSGWLDRLAGLINPEMTAAGGQASGLGSLSDLYQNDATNRVNVGNTATGGLASQNTQAANAKMTGASNLLNLGTSLLGLGVGAYGRYKF